VSKFYLKLWFYWAIRVTLCSLVLAFILSSFITIFIYVKQGMLVLNADIVSALWNVFKFWFMIFWNFTLLIALFRSIKYIFNRCYSGYMFRLYACEKTAKEEVIQVIGYGDLIKVWRRWFMLLIWLVGSQMVILLAFTLLMSSYSSLFEWFNIYVLFGLVLSAGYISFIVLGNRCKQTRIVKC